MWGGKHGFVSFPRLILDNLPLLEMTLLLEMVSDAGFPPYSWQILTFVCLTFLIGPLL